MLRRVVLLWDCLGTKENEEFAYRINILQGSRILFRTTYPMSFDIVCTGPYLFGLSFVDLYLCRFYTLVECYNSFVGSLRIMMLLARKLNMNTTNVSFSSSIYLGINCA